MATETERPPSRIGKKVNPAYTAWRRANILKKDSGGALTESRLNAVLGTLIEGQERKEIQSGIKESSYGSLKETLTLRAISGARNTNFVRCALGNGDAVHARVRKGAAAKLIGKSIRVSVTEEDGEKKYTHLP